ncbi:hypothetical protein [Helicobacter cetorum]|uniref:Uncharacterized protein n=1 Tax=Helicobacter cetorum (strain ATCC BAA-540 / CCUG 52418 / MIT 99-5656) TaxID=1163745 RepID=I0ETL9_HELCM|nr:hypothetical protein [Helicobacter cetorum]AFI06288.1 hypothetical protein HCD_06430 [Helicobacter cetorum MIT 99-5656]
MKNLSLVFLLFVLLSYLGCVSNFNEDTYTLDLVLEKKTQASRKGEITQKSVPIITAIATHLNDVDSGTYYYHEYFLVEIFTQNQEWLDNDYISYKLFGKNPIGSEPLWVREINKEEFDGILETTNKWSRAFLIAFDKLDYLAVKEAKLELDAYSLGTIIFNFAYQVPLPQF